MNKLFVIAPDNASGNAFNDILVKKGLDTHVYFAKITPRVIGSELNKDPQVAEDLKEAILKGCQNGYKDIVIACNTLQIWKETALRLLPPEARDEVKIFTTFQALSEKYTSSKNLPIFIGTTPTTKYIKNFPTLITLGVPQLQDLVQEIVWRVKAVYKSDTVTAGKNLENLDSIEILNKKTDELVDILLKNSIAEIILGCTELPIAINSHSDISKSSRITFIDPAKILAEYITKNGKT